MGKDRSKDQHMGKGGTPQKPQQPIDRNLNNPTKPMGGGMGAGQQQKQPFGGKKEDLSWKDKDKNK